MQRTVATSPNVIPARRALPAPALVALGVIAVAALAALARAIASVAGPVPDVVIGLLAGALLGNTMKLPAALKPGISFVLRYVLRAAIVLFGFGLSLSAVVKTGSAALVLVVACFAIAMALGFAIARIFRLGTNVGTLLGAGTAICGGSAILAIGPLLGAKDEEIAYALSTIFAFNIIALIAFPLIGHALRLDDTAFGAWTGTAVNDTSVVVATGFAFSHAAGATATIVKLTRTLFLVPLALAIGLTARREAGGSLVARIGATVPWFVVFFVAAAALRSTNVVPAPALGVAGFLASFLIVMVLVAVGLNVDVRKMARLGSRPLVAGLTLATAMSLVSFALVGALHIR